LSHTVLVEGCCSVFNLNSEGRHSTSSIHAKTHISKLN